MSDECHLIVRKKAVSLGIPSRCCDLFEERQNSYGALATNIDTASRCENDTQIEEMFFFRGED